MAVRSLFPTINHSKIYSGYHSLQPRPPPSYGEDDVRSALSMKQQSQPRSTNIAVRTHGGTTRTIIGRTMFFQQNLSTRTHVLLKLNLAPLKYSWNSKRPFLPTEIVQQIIFEALRAAITPSDPIVDEDPLGPIAPLLAASGGRYPTPDFESTDRNDIFRPTMYFRRDPQTEEYAARLGSVYFSELRPALERVRACSKRSFKNLLSSVHDGLLCHDTRPTMLFPLRKLRSQIQQQLTTLKAIRNALEEEVRIAPRIDDRARKLPPQMKHVDCRHTADVQCLTRRLDRSLWIMREANAVVASCALPTYTAMYHQIVFLEYAGSKIDGYIEELESLLQAAKGGP